MALYSTCCINVHNVYWLVLAKLTILCSNFFAVINATSLLVCYQNPSICFKPIITQSWFLCVGGESQSAPSSVWNPVRYTCGYLWFLLWYQFKFCGFQHPKGTHTIAHILMVTYVSTTCPASTMYVCGLLRLLLRLWRYIVFIAITTNQNISPWRRKNIHIEFTFLMPA